MEDDDDFTEDFDVYFERAAIAAASTTKTNSINDYTNHHGHALKQRRAEYAISGGRIAGRRASLQATSGGGGGGGRRSLDVGVGTGAMSEMALRRLSPLYNRSASAKPDYSSNKSRQSSSPSRSSPRRHRNSSSAAVSTPMSRQNNVDEADFDDQFANDRRTASPAASRDSTPTRHGGEKMRVCSSSSSETTTTGSPSRRRYSGDRGSGGGGSTFDATVSAGRWPTKSSVQWTPVRRATVSSIVVPTAIGDGVETDINRSTGNEGGSRQTLLDVDSSRRAHSLTTSPHRSPAAAAKMTPANTETEAVRRPSTRLSDSGTSTTDDDDDKGNDDATARNHRRRVGRSSAVQPMQIVQRYFSVTSKGVVSCSGDNSTENLSKTKSNSRKRIDDFEYHTGEAMFGSRPTSKPFTTDNRRLCRRASYSACSSLSPMMQTATQRHGTMNDHFSSRVVPPRSPQPYRELYVDLTSECARKNADGVGNTAVNSSASAGRRVQQMSSGDVRAPARPGNTFSVLVVGELGVGKSELVRHFSTASSLGSADHLFQDQSSAAVYVNVDGRQTNLNFIEYSSFANGSLSTMIEADGYLVAYSMTDRASFRWAVSFISDITGQDDDVIESPPVIILVANKSDLVRKRQVTTAEATDVCKSRRCKYAEVSATLGHRVDCLLVGLVSQLELRRSAAECLTSAAAVAGNGKDQPISHHSQPQQQQHQQQQQQQQNDPSATSEAGGRRSAGSLWSTARRIRTATRFIMRGILRQQLNQQSSCSDLMSL